jgi:hypothetical protein
MFMVVWWKIWAVDLGAWDFMKGKKRDSPPNNNML